MSVHCWPPMAARRGFDFERGHLVVADGPSGPRHALTTGLAEHNDRPALIYLSSTSDEGNLDVLNNNDQVTVVDYGKNWSVIASADAADIAFARGPGGFPPGSLLLSETGPVAIALKANDGQRLYHLFETSTATRHEPKSLAAVKKWSIQLSSETGRHTIANVIAR